MVIRDGKIIRRAGHKIELPEIVIDKKSLTIGDFKFDGKLVKGQSFKLGKDAFYVWVESGSLKSGKIAKKNTVIAFWNGKGDGWVVGKEKKPETNKEPEDANKGH